MNNGRGITAEKLQLSALLLVIVSPLVSLVTFHGLVYPYITSKVLCWFFLVELLGILSGILIWFGRPDIRELLRNPVRCGFLLYVGVLLITAVTGENFSGSLWGLLERGDGLIFYVHLAAFVVLAAVVLRGPRDWRTLMQSMVVAGALSALFGIAEAVGIPRRPGEPWVRVGSVFGNPNHLGHFLLFGIFFALALLGEHARAVFALGGSGRQRWARLVRTWQCWWYVGVLALQGWGLALTGSRGTSLALVAGLGVAGGLVTVRRMLRRQRRSATLLWSAGVVMVVAAVVVTLGRFDVVGQLRPFFNYSLHPDGTAARRLAIWQAGFDALPER